MALIDFPYEDGFSDVKNQILYYESSRGCPFNCQYCLSSVEKGVRFRPLELVFCDLKRFLDFSPKQVKFVDRTFNCNKKHAMSISSVEKGVRFRPLELVFCDLKRFLDFSPKQVKFVDRTFNCNKKHAMSIWHFLMENDNGKTNFHFELSADLLDDECIEFLSTVRPGLFQFEIGVQTTNKKTAEAICRSAGFDKISKAVTRLSKPKNIHLHLDLIAGLPHEDYSSQRQSAALPALIKYQKLLHAFPSPKISTYILTL